MPRLSANLGLLWPDAPLLARIDSAAGAGFRAAELHWPYDTPAAEVRDACARRGLELLALNTPRGDGPGDFGLAAVPGRCAEFRAGFVKAATYARDADAAFVHVLAGNADDPERVRETLLNNLAWAAAEAPDLTLLLEPMNRRDRPGYFYARPEQAAAVIDAVGAPNLALLFDAYHAGMEGIDVIAAVTAHLPRVAHVQIAAVPSRAEPDEGDLDCWAVLAALDRLGYAGWIGCEYNPRGATDAGLKWRSALGL
jgi:hydroxypyruvate isomerase